MIDNFLDFGLSNDVLNAVAEMGFEKPTPVQAQIIPFLLAENGDAVCLAQTGTGKTAAFGLPLLEYTDPGMNRVQSLILSPTRELCRQIAQDLANYSKYVKGIKIVSLYGGAMIDRQIASLKGGAHIIVATPGRLLDIIRRNAVDISGIETLVLDEADEMLDMGFKEELDAILLHAPSERRTLLFSATLPKSVEGIAGSYMKNPITVTVGERNAGSENVEHFYYMVKEEDRYAALKRIADYNPDIYAIVFCKTREETKKIAESLQRDGYDADALHGDLSQAQRDSVMKRFKSRGLHMLVATDVAARGIDVNNLTHVINYNLPQETELYTHRSGRTGRADKKGVSIAIINQREKGKIKRIESVIKKQFTRLMIPGAKEICEKQLTHLIGEINTVEVRNDIYSFMPLINELWGDTEKEDLVKKVLSYEFNRFFDYYRKAKDINLPEKPERHKSRKDPVPGEQDGVSGTDGKKKGREKETAIYECEKGFSWIRLNLGYKNKILPKDVLNIFKELGIAKKAIGKIEITHDCLYAAVRKDAARYAVSELKGCYYGRRRLTAEIYE